MSASQKLRARAAGLAAPLPPLLAEADRLAASVLPGFHGRRRPGPGDEFWQYRPAADSDALRDIDWRRSARSDDRFVRQKEWQLAQSVLFWCDQAPSMAWSSHKNLPQKSDRAALLTLAAAVLLVRAGERVGLAGSGRGKDTASRSGEAQIIRMAAQLAPPDRTGQNQAGIADYGVPDLTSVRSNVQLVFLSDFLGNPDPVMLALHDAAGRGVQGILLQVLDPAEEAFPWQGRTVFESVGGTLRHETQKASDLRGQYLQRLAARKDLLADAARGAGWQYYCHHSDGAAAAALLWLYQALERRHGC